MIDTKNQLPAATDDTLSKTVEPDASSCPTIQLPQKKYSATLTQSNNINPQTDQPNSNADSLSGLNVLVVEDCEITQMVIESMLEQFGCVTHLVENGQHAVEAMQNGSFDFILMDGQMPVMNGYIAAELIRLAEGDHGGRIPILAITASTLPIDKQRSIDCGMDDFMSKPLKEKDLKDMLLRNLPKRHIKAA